MILLISAARGRGHGAERILTCLLEAWPDAAATFAVLAPSDAHVSGVARRLGIATVPLDVRGSVAGNIAAVYQALPALPRCRVVHGWTAITFELAAAVALRQRLPYTLTLHDHPQAAYFSPARQTLLRLTAAGAGALICVSQAVRDACLRAGFTGNLAVIRNGLPAAPAHVPRDGRGRIGFLGLEHAHKGFAIVKDWAARLSPPATFHVYGRAAPGARIAEESGLRYRGHLPPQRIFGEIDAVVHPSLIFDSLPTVLLEAARAGLPAVATAIGGASEIVEHGVTGLLFPAGAPEQGFAQLQALMGDAAARLAMGQAARRRFSSAFTIERMIEDYRALWSALS